MKKILLTSSGKFITRNNIDHLLPKKIIDCKIAYITTASKKVDDVTYIENHKKSMDKLNFKYTEIDIDNQKESDLKEILQGFDIILVEGGNSFYLLKAIRESGFENIIKDLISKGVIYIGSSAGSYVACPSIIFATHSNQNFDRCGITNYKSMNLVPFLIKAHYKPDELDKLKDIAKDLKYEVILLNDDQALFIHDGKIQLLGGGDEIII